MGGIYTDAQKKASIKYQSNHKYIKAWVTEEQHKNFKAHAESKGETLSSLIVKLLEADMRES